jgi:hypothetical protein
MAQARSGGGINSSVVKQVDIKSGSPNLTAYSPRGVSQLGVSQGSMLSKTGAFTSRPSAAPLSEGQKRDFVPLGNQLATNVGQGSPGAGRQVYRAGSQSSTPAASMPQGGGGKDILSQFGPDSDPASLVDRRS